ncbi:lactate racemase domain-containing protein [Candidatus Auribacterota bacterium]
MKEISLPYGKQDIKWELPAGDISVFRCDHSKEIDDIGSTLRSSLNEPIDSAPLRERVKPSDKIAIIVSDSARLFPQDKILGTVLEEIGHADPADISIVIASGNHEASDPASIGIGRDIQSKFKVINHNSSDKKNMKSVGTLPSKESAFFRKQAMKHISRSVREAPRNFARIVRLLFRGDIEGIKAVIGYTTLVRALLILSASSKNEIKINSTVAQADLRILIGQIKPHFLSGFSGGHKAVFPGCAEFTGIAKNHFMMNHPSVGLGKNDGNIIRGQIEESSRFCGDSFAVNVVMNSNKTVAGIFCGDPVTAQRQGSELCRSIGNIKTEKADIVIAAEGYPEAINLYQHIKVIPPAGKIVREGGAIICVGSCSRGLGGLSVVNEVTCKIGFWHILPKDVRLYLVSDLPKDVVDKTMFIYAPNIDQAVEAEKKIRGDDLKITVLAGAGLMVPDVSTPLSSPLTKGGKRGV